MTKLQVMPLMTPELADQWVRRGVVWSIVIGFIGLLVILARSATRVDPFAYTDVVVPILLGVGIWRRSRAAAVGQLVYWISSKIIQVVDGRVMGPVLGLLVLGYVFLNVVRATYLLHRIRKAAEAEAPPGVEPRQSSGKERILAAAAALVVVAGGALLFRFAGRNDATAVPQLDAVLPADPMVRADTLANGVRYFVRPNQRPRKVVELRLVVDVGSILEDESERGFAHAIEHMVFRGTRSFPGRKSTDYLQSVGLTVGDEVNAQTAPDETVYRMTIPNGDPAVLDSAIAILADWAYAATFDTSEARQEAGVVMEEWRTGSTAHRRLSWARDSVLLNGSLYDRRAAIGDVAVLRRFDIDAMRRFYHEWYRPELMAVIAVGDFESDQVERSIRKRFGAIPARTERRARPLVKAEFAGGMRAHVLTDVDATTTQVALWYPRPHVGSTTVGGFREALIGELSRSILEERLTELADQPDSPLMYTDVLVRTLARPVEAHSVSASVSNDQANEGLATLARHVAALKAHGPTKLELERVKEQMLEPRRENDSYGRLSEDLIDMIQWYHLHGDLLLAHDTEYELASLLLPGIDSADVMRFVATLSPDSGATVIVTTRSAQNDRMRSIEEQLALIDAVRGGEANPWPRPVEAPMPKLIEIPPTPGRVDSQEVHTDITVFEWRLQNGMRVIVKPTRFSESDFTMRITASGGASLADKGDYPSAYMADRVIDAVGIGALSGGQLSRLLATNSLSVSPVVSDHALSLSIEGEINDLDAAFQLGYLYFTAVRSDTMAFSRYRQRALMFARTRDANPEAAFEDSIAAVLPGRTLHSPSFTPPFVNEIRLDRALGFWRDRTRNAANFTLVIVGDVTLERLRPLVERYFASLPAGRAERARDHTAMLTPRRAAVSFKRDAYEKSHTTLLYTGTVPLTFDTELSMRTLRSALQLVLENKLRESLGGTYSVNVELRIQPKARTPYVFSIDFEADPNRVDSLTAIALEEIDALRKTGPSAADVNALQVDLADKTARGEKSNSYWLGELAWAAQLGWELQTVKWHRDDTLSVSSAKIAESARQYLDTKRYARVTMRPATTNPARRPE